MFKCSQHDLEYLLVYFTRFPFFSLRLYVANFNFFHFSLCSEKILVLAELKMALLCREASGAVRVTCKLYLCAKISIPNIFHISGYEIRQNQSRDITEAKPEEIHYGSVNFSEVVQEVASTMGSELVYAYDEEGKQVAVGLLVPGPLEKIDAEDTPSNYPWIAAEEVCPGVEVGVELQSKDVKDENPCTHDDLKKWPKLSGLVKTYKSKKVNRKTLKQMRANLDEIRKE